MDEGVVINKDDVMEIAMNFSDGNGVDAVIITASTESSEPLKIAGQICRERGRVSSVGLTGMEIPRSIYYEKELDFRLSRSYGPGRYSREFEEKGLDYPIGYVRWTEKRNMEEFIRLLSEGYLNLEQMITHIFSIDDALDAYKMITENPNNEDYTGVLISYDIGKEPISKIYLKEETKIEKKKGVISVGVIGGGNFARGVILPILHELSDVSVDAVADVKGEIASFIGRKYNSRYTTSDYKGILNDDSIDLVVITTPHNLHAEMVIESLKSGKHVYVEKPLCINQSELEEIIKVYNSTNSTNSMNPTNPSIMVGFNRRFSPAAKELKSRFSNCRTPLMIYYRVNAGQIPKDHWMQDPEVGGGRIIGEVCHFIDLMQFITDSKPVKVYASKVKGKGNIIEEDNISVIIDFKDGSRGIVLYTSLGSKSFPKEYIEVFGGRRVETINNFRVGKFGLQQDKGHKEEFKRFVNAILEGRSSPISIESLYYTTLTTFRIIESLRKGSPVRIEE